MSSQSELFSGQTPVVLIDTEIRTLIDNGKIFDKTTYDPTCLESCSYDLRVGSSSVMGGTGQEVDLDDQGLDLPPGGYAGLISWERLLLPKNVFARLGAKRAYSYDGIILLTGALVDPGYHGHLLFGVYNASQKKFVFRRGAKICNVVFERLSGDVDRAPTVSPDLNHGRIPDDFINKMANMDVLPWMQISERVKQIGQMTADILDLKQRYQDVLEPIKELTTNVTRVSQDVDKLSDRTAELREVTSANAEQLRQVGMDLSTITAQLSTSVRNAEKAEERSEATQEGLSDLRTRVGRFQLSIYIVFSVLLVVFGSFLPTIWQQLFGN